ncbi:NUDIX domain-containing protein [Candidatus Protochlamydia amoebophila]|nr:NUDIX domain-containing protein [Candidatus Protochlamydia amoebophila]
MSEFFKNRPNDFFSNLRVVTCFIEYKDTILFLQRSKSLIAPLKWAIPSGKVEKKENNFAALKREIFEELALKIDNPNSDVPTG